MYVGKTISIGKTPEGMIFGGYHDYSWYSPCNYVGYYTNNFLFRYYNGMLDWAPCNQNTVCVNLSLMFLRQPQSLFFLSTYLLACVTYQSLVIVVLRCV
jgi:hypothetical protein